MNDGRRQSPPRDHGDNGHDEPDHLFCARAAGDGGRLLAGPGGHVGDLRARRATEHHPGSGRGSPQPKQQAQAPQRRSVARPEQAAQPSGGGFDGTWAVASSPGCGLVARSAVRVARGRISGQGVSGSIDASGNVRTVSYGGGLSVISRGRRQRHLRLGHLPGFDRLHRHVGGAEGLSGPLPAWSVSFELGWKG